jgi:hypothetical protein
MVQFTTRSNVYGGIFALFLAVAIDAKVRSALYIVEKVKEIMSLETSTQLIPPFSLPYPE